MNLINRVLSTFKDKYVVTFIGNISVYSKNEEDHIKHLRIVLETLEKKKFYGKYSKCEFWLESISFIGHIISEDEISINPSKIAAVRNWPVSKLVIEMISFHRLVGYYQRFVQNFLRL